MNIPENLVPSGDNEKTFAEAELVASTRKARGLTERRRKTAEEIVRAMMPGIKRLREAGHSQADAVIYVEATCGVTHKADTIKKAIKAEIGRWKAPRPTTTSQTGNGTPDAAGLGDVAPGAFADTRFGESEKWS